MARVKINKDTLERLRKAQYSNPLLGSWPEPMFVDGVFNPDNWNGGDDIIRDFFYDVEYSGDWARGYELDDYDVIINFNYFNDQAYGTVIVRGITFEGESFDVYLLSWYKHRGKTEVAQLNGQPLEESKYLELLNLIEKIGYKFKGVDYENRPENHRND